MNKVNEGWTVFRALKAEDEKVTKSKIAKLAKFSKSMLSRDKSTGQYKNKAWSDLAKAIDIYLCEAERKPKRNRYKEVLIARDNYLKQRNEQVKENAELLALQLDWEHDKNYHKNQYQLLVTENADLKVQLRDYQRAFEQHKIVSNSLTDKNDGSESSVTPIRQEVISPDAEMLRINNGAYAYDNSRIKKKSHRAAQAKLLTSVSKNVPIRLYVMIGKPGAGKSYWIENHRPPYDRIPIYYDATNSEAGDRMDILDIAKASSDCIVCLVYIDTPIERCIKRNVLRPNRGITDEMISSFKIEPPEWDEGFNELIIVR